MTDTTNPAANAAIILRNALYEIIAVAEQCDSWQSFPQAPIDAAKKAIADAENAGVVLPFAPVEVQPVASKDRLSISVDECIDAAQMFPSRDQFDTDEDYQAAVATIAAAASANATSFQDWYTGISIEGDMKHNMRRAWDAALSKQPAAAPDGAPTDLSKRLRAKATAPFGPEDFVLLTQAADEIERYHSGMLAWKKTAEKKDSDWNAERMARITDRCANRFAAPSIPAAVGVADGWQIVAWANWKDDSDSYVPYRTKNQATACVKQSSISATQDGPYSVVPLYARIAAAAPSAPAEAPDAHQCETVTGGNLCIYCAAPTEAPSVREQEVFDVLYAMRLAPRHQLQEAAKRVCALQGKPEAPKGGACTGNRNWACTCARKATLCDGIGSTAALKLGKHEEESK